MVFVHEYVCMWVCACTCVCVCAHVCMCVHVCNYTSVVKTHHYFTELPLAMMK